jgi:hypothetical protein
VTTLRLPASSRSARADSREHGKQFIFLRRGTPERLGHAENSTTAMTLDVYTGRSPELDRQAGELMDQLLDADIR